MARTEVCVSLPRRPHDDVIGQEAVGRARDAVHGDAAVREEVDNLAVGMDAGICAAGRRELDGVAEDRLQFLF